MLWSVAELTCFIGPLIASHLNGELFSKYAYFAFRIVCDLSFRGSGIMETSPLYPLLAGKNRSYCIQIQEFLFITYGMGVSVDFTQEKNKLLRHVKCLPLQSLWDYLFICSTVFLYVGVVIYLFIEEKN